MTELNLFGETLAVLRAGFELRKPDAWDNALMLREKYAREGRDLGAIASHDAVLDKAREAIMRAQAIDELMREYANANLLQERGRFGPTPEAIVRPGRDNALLALLKAGHIDDAQDKAAAEIAQILEAVTASLHARGGTAMRSTCGAKVGDFIPVHLSEWYSNRYLPWVGAMMRQIDAEELLHKDGSQDLELVLAVVRDGLSASTAARKRGMHPRRGIRLLRNGLSLYAKIRSLNEDGHVFHGWRERALGKGRTA